ncbi:MAG: PilZ domain-containing protein [Pseudomonadota bacterium]|nr:MAG: PilZ domain-containing protein [Pseudomonadota bacterium]
MAERRTYWRRPVNARVRLRHASFGETGGLTRDISDGGVFVHPEEHIPELVAGSALTLQFVDSVNPDLQFNMKVMRVLDEGVGLSVMNYELNGVIYDLGELRRQWELYNEDSGARPAPVSIAEDEYRAAVSA